MSNVELDIAIVGAGFTGIGAAIKLQEAGITKFRVFEKTEGISGTWHNNTYPGAACDVPSHLYCFSFAPNPNWSRIYSPQAEIKQYAQNVVDQYGLRDQMQFNTEIVSAKFEPSKNHWVLQTQNNETIIARFVIWSVAFLNTPATPNFAGLEQFEGPVFHTAEWDHTVDLSDKNIAVIGSAASALQVGPEIAPLAKKLSILQRTANYVMPRDDRTYSKFEKFLFRTFPWTNKLLRNWLFWRHDKFFFHGMRPGSWVNSLMTNRSLSYVRQKIKDPVLRDKLTADYELGCKRILVSDDFYDMFLWKNVHLETVGIDRIEPDGVVHTDGTKTAADIIIMATGFTATEFMPGLQITGVDGANLETWRDDMRALKGLLLDGFPNAFFMLGPNTGLGHSSMILMIESQLKYVLDVITQLKPDQQFAPKAKAVEAYNEQIQADLSERVWATSCQSWYKRKDGFIPTMWPHSTGDYDKMMKKVNWSELDISECAKLDQKG